MEPARAEKLAFPLPEKPSIAVLPFDNMSGDPGQNHFADGITEEIITALSKISNMFVIARNSTFSYKGKPVKVQQVAEELGVRYVLEGSVRRSGDKVRITAQLVDATTGYHLWSERYDRESKEIFALQDEITKNIVTALEVKLTAGESARVWASSFKNVKAWELAQEGLQAFRRNTKKDNARARELFNHAVELDPEYPVAWAMVAWTHWLDARFRWSESPRSLLNRPLNLHRRS